MKELVLIHGRSQQNYDSVKLKQRWIDSFKEGLAKSGLTLPISEDRIRFPYYGDTLAGLVSGIPQDEVAKVVVRGDGADEAEKEFIRSVIMEVIQQQGITDEQIQECADKQIVERGIANWEWVQSGLKALDRWVPGASGAAVALATKDVFKYLTNPVMRDLIDEGVKQALQNDEETVVVGHSLGAVVSYNVLHRYGKAEGWKIPLYATVGAPLGVTKIKKMISPISHPGCAGKWFNAMDERDVVALYPLNERNFNIDPLIENKTGVKNETPNHHGISGYLSDEVVAKRLHDALV